MHAVQPEHLAVAPCVGRLGGVEEHALMPAAARAGEAMKEPRAEQLGTSPNPAVPVVVWRAVPQT
jgi:hypothetical protein